MKKEPRRRLEKRNKRNIKKPHAEHTKGTDLARGEGERERENKENKR